MADYVALETSGYVLLETSGGLLTETSPAFNTWNGSATVNLIDSITTNGTASTPLAIHGSATISETVSISTNGHVPLYVLVPAETDSFVLTPI